MFIYIYKCHYTNPLPKSQPASAHGEATKPTDPDAWCQRGDVVGFHQPKLVGGFNPSEKKISWNDIPNIWKNDEK